jgi:lycopene beta-cyclase
VLGLCLTAAVPLEFAFGLHVLRDPGRLVRALAVPVLVFVVWDIVAIDRATWWYNDRYVTGWEAALGLPIEELCFFIVIPLVGLLSYETVRRLLEGRGG